MTARLYAHVLVVLRANFAQLERGAHLAVELVLFLSDLDVILGRGGHRPAKIWVYGSSVRIQVAVSNEKIALILEHNHYIIDIQSLSISIEKCLAKRFVLGDCL